MVVLQDITSCAYGCITRHKVCNYTINKLVKPNLVHRQQRPYKVIKDLEVMSLLNLSTTLSLIQFEGLFY